MAVLENQGFNEKDSTSPNLHKTVSPLNLNEIYENAISAGAIGGKLLGAGGGGYFLVFTDKNYDLKQDEWLNNITFKIKCDWFGAGGRKL